MRQQVVQSILHLSKWLIVTEVWVANHACMLHFSHFLCIQLAEFLRKSVNWVKTLLLHLWLLLSRVTNTLILESAIYVTPEMHLVVCLSIAAKQVRMVEFSLVHLVNL